MEWVLRSPQTHSTFSNLGFMHADGYHVNESCNLVLEGILHNILAEDRYLRPYRRTINFGQHVQKDLIPLLLNAKEDETVELIIRILVNLTTPIECLLSVETISQSDFGRHTLYELNNLLASTKKSFTDDRATKVLMDFFKKNADFTQQSKITLDQCTNISNCLLLFRNLLHIPEDANSSSPGSNGSVHAVQNQILWNIFSQSFDKVLIRLMTIPEARLWGVSLVQLIALLYKDQHATTLHKLLNVWVETGLSDSSEDNESNTTPPNRRSEDSSPMLTSDPTSDSSDTGASGKNNEEPNSENNGWGAFSENNTSENGSPPCQQPVENDSDITMRDKNENETLKSDENKTAKVITAIREFVQAIDAYKKFPHLNPQDHEKLDTLRTKMCELDELRSLLVLLLRTYNPKYHSKAYLQDLIVTNHLLLLFLDIGMRSPDGDYSLMTEHIQQFASPEIMYQYALLLEDYMENGDIRMETEDFEGDEVLKKLTTLSAPEKEEIQAPDMEKKKTAQSGGSNASNKNKWTENDLSSLSWHYMQCNTQQDVVGEIVICYKEDGSTKTRDSVIKALYKQNIINKEEFDKLSKKETDRCSKMKKINKEIRDVEIGKLCEQLRQDGKYKCFEWVQTVLLKACHVKLYFEKKTLRCAEDNLTKVEGSNILQFKFFNQEIQELPVLSPVSYHSLPKLKFSMDDLANVGAYPVQHCASVHPLENYYQIHKQRHLATMLTFIPIAPVEPIVLTEDILGDNVAVKAELREEVDEPLLPPNEDNFDADLSDFDDDDSVCDTASVVSDLTRMYVSDEDEKSQLPPRPRGKMHSHSPMGLFTEIPMT
ncbi:hypothetical protein MSG28_002193 [Choristoneura fumiferana]|uniref:Uncharacterized protein n=1 Tax=Choristoneura fumiferana TaxID=7141 RepID=A0ACC0JUQ7_CHOFU|nr:hypothetical protein MSG28_002193 [Choristoneura fumiferana]